MIFGKESKLKKEAKVNLKTEIRFDLFRFDIPVGNIYSVSQLIQLLHKKYRFSDKTVVEDLEFFLLDLLNRDFQKRNYISTYNLLVENGYLPRFNNELANHYSESNYLKKIVLERIKAFVLDTFVAEHPEFSNMSTARLLQIFGEKTNNIPATNKITNDYFKNKVFIDETVDFARKLDLMFENSGSNFRVQFINDYDHNNQFTDPLSYDLFFDCKKRFNDNFKILFKNYDEIIDKLNNSEIRVFFQNGVRDGINIRNLNFDFNKMDTIFIPLSHDLLSENKCFIYSKTYWDNLKIEILKPNRRELFSLDEKKEILTEISNEIVNY